MAYISVIRSNETGLIDDARPAQPNCSNRARHRSLAAFVAAAKNCGDRTRPAFAPSDTDGVRHIHDAARHFAIVGIVRRGLHVLLQ
ncbi:MAG: hypothetical protein QOF90_1277 [Acetobacteraceae bacterium]|nr:hypothetical protein [Acetobacteraceae bacterium]